MPRTQQILAGIVARPREIADRFIGGGGWGDLGEHPRSQQFGQLARIAPIRLDVIARLPRNEGRSNHLAAHALARQLPLQGIPARSGFVTALDEPRRLALQLANQPPDRVRLVG